MPTFYMTFNYKTFGFRTFKDDHFLTIVGIIGMLWNGWFRPVFGFLFDKFGFKQLMLSVITLQTALLVSLPFLENREMYTVWVCAMLITSGGIFVMMAAQCLKVFGINYGARILPFLIGANLVSNMTFYAIDSLMLPWLGAVTTFVVVMPIYQCIAFFLVLRYNDEEEIDFNSPQESLSIPSEYTPDIALADKRVVNF